MPLIYLAPQGNLFYQQKETENKVKMQMPHLESSLYRYAKWPITYEQYC